MSEDTIPAAGPIRSQPCILYLYCLSKFHVSSTTLLKTFQVGNMVYVLFKGLSEHDDLRREVPRGLHRLRGLHRGGNG